MKEDETNRAPDGKGQHSSKRTTGVLSYLVTPIFWVRTSTALEGTGLNLDMLLVLSYDSPEYPRLVVPNFGPPDVHGLQLPEILASRGGGEGFWEL